MANKIFHSTLLVAVVVLLCSFAIIMGVLYSHFDSEQIRQLQDELHLAAAGTEQSGTSYLENTPTGSYRLTWVSPEGTVLYDSQADASAMESHADREEIKEALMTGTGSSSRNSITLMEQTVYEAVRLSDGSVLRISTSRATSAHLVLNMLQPSCIVLFIAIVLSALLSHRIAKKIVEPLNTLDLENPLSNDTYEEMQPLLQRINQQHLQIDRNLRKLRRKSDEFQQITANMQEGLLVLDKETRIRSINPTAQRIFSVSESCMGTSFLTVSQNSQLRQALNDALDKGHGTAMMELHGREYRFDMNGILSEGNLLGAVILAVDITEERNSERSRREFSANVSHELKTPLQSIIGSAELLENGLVRPEDTPRFVGHIRTEAARLVNLVEDIIRLSQLDEGVAIPMEEVELLELATEVAATMQDTAAARQISLTVQGESCRIQGVRRLLYEVLYNLCDNAIKYNIPGGNVTIRVADRELSVTDTGIGIPQEHHERIFERFYRVDKSHSKESGGTGLGLSIVKHAVQYHNAKLQLRSAPGTGTCITITFPLQKNR